MDKLAKRIPARWIWHRTIRAEKEVFFTQYELLPSVFKQLAAILGPQKAAELEDAHYQREGAGPKMLPIEAEVMVVTVRAHGTLQYGNTNLIPSTLVQLEKFKRPFDPEQTRMARMLFDARHHDAHLRTKVFAAQKRVERMLRHTRGVFIPSQLERLSKMIDPRKAAEVADAYYQQEGIGARTTKRERYLEGTVEKLLKYQEKVFVPKIRDQMHKLVELTHAVEQQTTTQSEDAIQPEQAVGLDTPNNKP